MATSYMNPGISYEQIVLSTHTSMRQVINHGCVRKSIYQKGLEDNQEI